MSNLAMALTGGLTGLIFVGVMIVGDSGRPEVFGAMGHGGAERMIVYPSLLAIAILGGYLMALPGDIESG